MQRLARGGQSRRAPLRQTGALLAVAALLALGAVPGPATASPPAQQQYTLHIPGSKVQGPLQSTPSSGGSTSPALIVLVAGLLVVAAGAGTIALRNRAQRDST
jgi:hypothetical protein